MGATANDGINKLASLAATEPQNSADKKLFEKKQKRVIEVEGDPPLGWHLAMFPENRPAAGLLLYLLSTATAMPLDENFEIANDDISPHQIVPNLSQPLS